MDNKHIVILEDDANLLEIFRLCLEIEGYIIIDPQQASDYTTTTWIIDLQYILKLMSNKIIYNIKPQDKLIFISGMDDDPTEIAKVWKGRYEFLLKPFTIEKLLYILHK